MVSKYCGVASCISIYLDCCCVVAQNQLYVVVFVAHFLHESCQNFLGQ